MANEAKTAEQQAADERKRREEQNRTAEEQLKLQSEKQQKINEEAQQRMDEAVPTPTQEENDRAALGIHDEDADEGATAEPKKRQATAQSGSAQYQTREQQAQPKT